MRQLCLADELRAGAQVRVSVSGATGDIELVTDSAAVVSHEIGESPWAGLLLQAYINVALQREHVTKGAVASCVTWAAPGRHDVRSPVMLPQLTDDVSVWLCRSPLRERDGKVFAKSTTHCLHSLRENVWGSSASFLYLFLDTNLGPLDLEQAFDRFGERRWFAPDWAAAAADQISPELRELGFTRAGNTFWPPKGQGFLLLLTWESELHALLRTSVNKLSARFALSLETVLETVVRSDLGDAKYVVEKYIFGR